MPTSNHNRAEVRRNARGSDAREKVWLASLSEADRAAWIQAGPVVDVTRAARIDQDHDVTEPAGGAKEREEANRAMRVDRDRLSPREYRRKYADAVRNATKAKAESICRSRFGMTPATETLEYLRAPPIVGALAEALRPRIAGRRAVSALTRLVDFLDDRDPSFLFDEKKAHEHDEVCARPHKDLAGHFGRRLSSLEVTAVALLAGHWPSGRRLRPRQQDLQADVCAAFRAEFEAVSKTMARHARPSSLMSPTGAIADAPMDLPRGRGIVAQRHCRTCSAISKGVSACPACGAEAFYFSNWQRVDFYRGPEKKLKTSAKA